MTEQEADIHNPGLYYRLIALWVTCEGFAGGLLHAFKFPFSGMIISSAAITVIMFIAYYFPSHRAVIRATIVVAFFKLLISPHSPPTAYIAVFFQGALGQLLLSKQSHFKARAMIFGLLALAETALQRILVLVIIYGNDMVTAIDAFIHKLTNSGGHYSWMLAIGYVSIHAVAGIFIGGYVAGMVQRSKHWQTKYAHLIFLVIDAEEAIPVTKVHKKHRRSKWLIMLVWVILVGLWIQSRIQPGNAILPQNMIINILLRSVLIIAGWYLLLSPVFLWLLQHGLKYREKKYRKEINEVRLLLPGIRAIFMKAYSMSVAGSGIQRLKLFLKTLMINILVSRIPPQDH